MRQLKKYLFLIFAILFFGTGITIENSLLNPTRSQVIYKQFENQLHKQEKLLNNYLNKIQTDISQSSKNDYTSQLHQLVDLYKQHHIGFLLLKGNQIIFWSNNKFSFSEPYLPELEKDGIHRLPNGIYLSKRHYVNDISIIGLILIQQTYSIQNRFVQNSFAPEFDLPINSAIHKEHIAYGYPIHNLEGNYLFSIYPTSKIRCKTQNLYIPALLFAIALLCFLIFIVRLYRYPSEQPFFVKMLGLFALLFCTYWIHILFQYPSSWTALELFNPYNFAYSSWLPSLGDLLFLSTLIFTWSIVFSEHLSHGIKLTKTSGIIALVFAFLLYIFCYRIIFILIHDSSFTFQLNKIDDLNNYSVIGYIIIAMLFLSACRINYSIIHQTLTVFNRKKFMGWIIILSIITGILCILKPSGYLYTSVLFLIISLSIFIYNPKRKQITFSYLIFLISIFTFFSLIIIQNENNQKRYELLKLRATTLNSEHDPNAEIFLTEAQKRINVDSIIPFLLNDPEKLSKYIQKQYFNSYFKKYDIQITICNGYDSLLVQPDNKYVPCFPFFDQLIKKYGTKIPQTNFYYMNNMDGRISYFGKLFYPLSSDSIGSSVFIELNSKLTSEGYGFPELLLDRSTNPPAQYKNLSYAKYFHKELVNLNGDYPYNYYINTYPISKTKQKYQLKQWDGYDHLIYNINNDNYIIVSAKSFRFTDYLVSFPYLFVFYTLFILLVNFIDHPRLKKLILVKDLKFKIQLAIISIVLFSLLFIAAGTLYYSVKEYHYRHQNSLNSKMNSVSEAITMRLMDEKHFNPELINWLWSELSNLSNVFKIDINIYSVQGQLIASSRPEIIYQRGFISDRMNSEAFYQLNHNFQTNFIQPEKIGKLSYLSVYQPIINSSGEYLGYINLPYFTTDTEFHQEISTYIVAFINLYVLLLFTSAVVAVLLSNQITRPLQLIREKLKTIQLNKENEKINYYKNDEIGALVNEYNRKVEELKQSADLLAHSERELAWREMAKQIAHEIKNPLTPMKLNIQFLQRAKNDNNKKYDELFNKVTNSLIEQIDNLSDIASTFSDFAKISQERKEKFNLNERLEHIINLYKTSDNIQINLVFETTAPLWVKTNKEQFSRAILNLIKNGIQSVPTGQQSIINLKVSALSGNIIHLEITDNGTGITTEAQKRLFQPNFTTKTSGMGLGLAIVKKIIETMNGKIWFETSPIKGTTFFLEFPAST